jgi:hypothetical protein
VKKTCLRYLKKPPGKQADPGSKGKNLRDLSDSKEPKHSKTDP